MKTGCLKALLIDDDEDCAQILRESISDDSRQLELVAVTDGSAGLQYLRQAADHPDFVLLDLELPCKNGFDILNEIRADVNLKTLPVMVLSSACDVRSIRRAYECGANIFFAKPLGAERYRELLSLIVSVWGGFAELPVPETI